MYPLLTWVYPGLDPAKIAALPQIIKEQYIDSIPEMMERWQTMLCNAASFPNMDPQGRKQMMKMWKPLEPLESTLPQVKITREQYFNQLAGAGIRMAFEEHVVPKGTFSVGGLTAPAEDAP